MLDGDDATHALRLENVTFSYGAVRVFDEVDWSISIAPGETVAFLGESGSGKSTALEVVTGFKRPQRGCILWDGADVTSLSPAQRRFVLVHQERVLFPGTVRDNVEFPLRARGVPADERRMRVAEIAALAGIGRYLDHDVTALSGGERQRTELARGLVAEPNLLLLDEPLAQLDTPLRLRLVEELREWVRVRGVRCLYVTHDAAEAGRVAGRVAVVHDRKIGAARSAADLYRDPAHLAEARLSGSATTLAASARGDGTIEVERAQLRVTGSAVPSGKVTVVFRPPFATLLDGAAASGDGLQLPVRVEGVYLVDGVQWIDARGAGGTHIRVAVMNGAGVTPSGNAVVAVDPANVFVFDEQGLRVPIESCTTSNPGEMP